jgi:uncharacterized protein
MKKKTIVLGASEKSDRYSNKAVRSLQNHNHPIIAVGFKEGEINGTPITKDFPEKEEIHTLTLYLSAVNQKPYYEKILALNPKRVIMNPGTENAELESLLKDKNIPFEHACTLVLLNIGQY